jgi:hypothetical protein
MMSWVLDMQLARLSASPFSRCISNELLKVAQLKNFYFEILLTNSKYIMSPIRGQISFCPELEESQRVVVNLVADRFCNTEKAALTLSIRLKDLISLFSFFGS